MMGVLGIHRNIKVWACDEIPVFYELKTNSTFSKEGQNEIKNKIN